MTTTSGKELYGLIGYPVSHSYSAFMHNAAFAHYGMNAEYQLFEVPPEGLDDFFKKTIFEKHLKGFNVTVPYKERAIAHLNASISPVVNMNKAVNTVRVETDGTLSGSNTDGLGFLRDLTERGVKIGGKIVFMIGAGGGAKAVATAIASSGPAKLLIFDIDPAKTDGLYQRIKKFFPNIVVEAAGSLESLGAMHPDILINATPVGMKESDPVLIKKEWLRPGLFVYDLIYNPAQTRLLKMAKEAGCRSANGLGMLLYQGALAFEYWTGKSAPVDVMRRALEEKMGEGR
ncbi:MAG: shikimate dehydrogenase [Candidatus Omnitrophica bacterium]|nr:shikimate dehydrogenase [Candidatus Omnitrophota bacterium]